MIKPEWTWMYFNEEWNQTKDNKIGLKSYMCNIDKDEDIDDDESTYVDGVDERPKPKQVEYNDDDYDY